MATSGFQLVEDFIINAETYANNSITKAFDGINSALQSANNVSFIELQTNPWNNFVWPDNLEKPFTKADIPNIDNNNFQYIQLYQNDWLEKYRLIMNENFNNLFSFRYSENKLEDILQNGVIIVKTVQDQIVNRAIDQEMSAFSNKKDEILLENSSRGWNLPSSFTVSRIDNLRKEVDDKISLINRDLVIKNQELTTEMTKFAIQISTELLPRCVDIASSFAGKYSQVYNYGAENVKNYLNGLSIVDQSIKNYHSTLISRVQTAVQESQSWRNYDLDSKNKKAQFELQKIDLNVKTTLAGVDALTRIGTAALSANQSIVNLGQQTVNTLTGTNVV